jgi:hypothetical protein
MLRESLFERPQGVSFDSRPDAEQRRQPQRDQPGGFFRPLFGRSKRGHPGSGDSLSGSLASDFFRLYESSD